MDNKSKHQMKLTPEENDILQGKKGDALKKAYESVISYGECFGASELAALTHAPHLVTSFGVNVIKPYFDILDSLIKEGLKTFAPFTVDPRPFDFENIRYSFLEKLLFKLIYSKQKAFENQMLSLGLKNNRAFSCACYLEEVGNIPQKGDILAWSESSAVVYANSVIGARCNRNSAGVDILCNIIGKAPVFGLLKDEERKAAWLVELKTNKLPDPQVLGGVIGMKVIEDVPFITGLAGMLGNVLDDAAKDYLKDMGAGAASNGAVGLYHVEGLTPEAVENGRNILKEGFQTYVIDDEELERVKNSYPVLWKKKDAKPQRAFIGCPHLSLTQLKNWVKKIDSAMKSAGINRLGVDTILSSAPDVVEKYTSSGGDVSGLKAKGVFVSSICPLMHMTNPLCAGKPVITNSNKLRTYTTARFLVDDDILETIITGKIREASHV